MYPQKGSWVRLLSLEPKLNNSPFIERRGPKHHRLNKEGTIFDPETSLLNHVKPK